MIEIKIDRMYGICESFTFSVHAHLFPLVSASTNTLFFFQKFGVGKILSFMFLK